MNYIGQAKDIHKIKSAKNTDCVLGGYHFKSNYKIVAHSDGDLVLHAIANALLGSIQAGDIGLYFPDSEPKFKNIDSKQILNHAINLVKAKGLKPVNIDLTIISDKIMINPIRIGILNSLMELLGTTKINVKATRFEQDKDLIACEVVLLMETK